MPTCQGPSCGARHFETVEALRQHVKTAKAHPRCRICDRGFLNETIYKTHRETHAKPRCDSCRRNWFRSYDALDQHYREADAHPNCERCGCGLENDDALFAHMASVHPKISCAPCQFEIVYLEELDTHYLESPNHPKCGKCNIGLRDTEAHEEHVRLQHPSDLLCDDRSHHGLELEDEDSDAAEPVNLTQDLRKPISMSRAQWLEEVIDEPNDRQLSSSSASRLVQTSADGKRLPAAQPTPPAWVSSYKAPSTVSGGSVSGSTPRISEALVHELLRGSPSLGTPYRGSATVSSSSTPPPPLSGSSRLEPSSRLPSTTLEPYQTTPPPLDKGKGPLLNGCGKGYSRGSSPLRCRLCPRDICEDITATMCGHVFCNGCITKAIIDTPACPVCQSPTLLYCLFRLRLHD
ncbi:hypothetical protein JAAARDRAFT_32511 [Jaapia argillacea MUCL 33604]|uniref:RING-type domain-containing protein n=1 Tax=Jaapia argillacea MUCL 33604 TaxID=933084 RepID=A0A067Q1T5_9AGAM|nr:hypothetical protein JAAARDRAFT_32511 [Jaapia argillacea MUCL 33604]